MPEDEPVPSPETTPETKTEVSEVKEKVKRFNPSLVILGILGLGFIIFVLIAPQGKQTGGPLPVGGPVPNFELKDLNGKTWSMASLRGSVVVINFWATWCSPCRLEMPSIDRLFRDTAEKENFVILTILYQDSPDNARAYFKKNGFEMPVLLDLGDSVAAEFGLVGLPETFMVDKKGILQKHHIGPVDFDSPDIRQFLDSLINK